MTSDPSAKASLRVALLQHDIAWRDPVATFELLTEPIRHAAGAGTQLCVLSETFSHGFVVADDPGAELEGGPSERFLLDQADAYDMWMAGSVIQIASDGHAHNNMVVASPRGSIIRYAKQRLFGAERDLVTPGSASLALQIDHVSITPFVCYDLRFANLWWERAAQTDLYLLTANWPQRRQHHWRSLTIARAIENQCYVAAVNRVGSGGGISYVGGSLVVDPWGQVIAEAQAKPHDSTVSCATQTLIVDIDTEVVHRARRSFPVLDHRKQGKPGRITERWSHGVADVRIAHRSGAP